MFLNGKHYYYHFCLYTVLLLPWRTILEKVKLTRGIEMGLFVPSLSYTRFSVPNPRDIWFLRKHLTAENVLIVSARIWGTEGMWWAGPRMLLSILQPHPYPQAKNYPAQDVNTAEFEKPCLNPLILKINDMWIVDNCGKQVLRAFNHHFVVSPCLLLFMYLQKAFCCLSSTGVHISLLGQRHS